MILRCFSVPEETANIVFYTGDAEESREDSGPDRLTVFRTDYTRLLQPYFKLIRPDVNRSRHNRITRAQWEYVIWEIEHDMAKIHFDDTVFDFYTRFAGWITKTLEESEEIHVDRGW